MRADVGAKEHSGNQRRAVPNRKHRHVSGDLAESVEEEDHAEQEEQMVVTGDHVLGAQVHEWSELRAAHLLQIFLVTFSDAMRRGGACYHEEQSAHSDTA